MQAAPHARNPRAPMVGSGLAIGLLASVGLLLIGLLSKSWIEFHDIGSGGGAGPLGLERCADHSDQCNSIEWSSLAHAGNNELFAHITLIAGIAGAVLAITAAVLVLARRATTVAYTTTRLVLVAGLGMAAYWQVKLSRTEIAWVVNTGASGVLCMGAMLAALVFVHRLAGKARAQTRVELAPPA